MNFSTGTPLLLQRCNGIGEALSKQDHKEKTGLQAHHKEESARPVCWEPGSDERGYHHKKTGSGG